MRVVLITVMWQDGCYQLWVFIPRSRLQPDGSCSFSFHDIAPLYLLRRVTVRTGRTWRSWWVSHTLIPAFPGRALLITGELTRVSVHWVSVSMAAAYAQWVGTLRAVWSPVWNHLPSFKWVLHSERATPLNLIIDYTFCSEAMLTCFVV